MKPKNTTERAIRKAVIKANGTKFDLIAAVILYRINGYENAMEYIDGIKTRREVGEWHAFLLRQYIAGMIGLSA